MAAPGNEDGGVLTVKIQRVTGTPDRPVEHPMVYAYGPLDRFEQILRGGGIQPVAEWAAPAVPYPHALYYHREWDTTEEEILQAFEWRRTPLHTEDVQFWSGPQAS